MAEEKPLVGTNNEEKEIDLWELCQTVWAARKRIVKYALVGAVVGLVIGFSIPKTYETSIRLAPESKSGSTNRGMAGLAAMAGVNLYSGNSIDGITTEIFPDVVKSTPFLLEFADIQVVCMPKKEGELGERMTVFEYVTGHQKMAWWSYLTAFPGKAVAWIRSIGHDEPDGELPPADSVDLFDLPKDYKSFVYALGQMLSVEEDKKTSLLKVTVSMQDPRVSALIADSLVSKLQKYMTAYRTRKTRYDLEQNMRQNAEAQARYYEAEDKLVEAIDQNRNISSESLRARIERLRNERNLAYNVYNQTASQVEMNKIKLQEATPIATVVEPAIVPDLASSPHRLLILIVFAFLGGFLTAGIVVAKSLLARYSEEKTTETVVSG